MKSKIIKVGEKKSGHYARKSVEAKNKDIIKKFFIENPGETKAECARATNLTWPTVNKHVKDILAEQERSKKIS